MKKRKEVSYVIGATLDAKPITVTHILSDEDIPEQKIKSAIDKRSKGVATIPITKRKTCSHAQKDARVKYQNQQTKKNN